MRPLRLVLVAVILADLTVAGGLLAIRSRDEPQPVSVGLAIERFRTSATAAPGSSTPTNVVQPTQGLPVSVSPVTAPPPTAVPTEAAAGEEPATATGGAPGRQPAPGVYVYDTTGWEETDALGGARHEYPTTSTITIRATGCGVVARWDVLEERSDEYERCPARDGGEHLAGFTSRHAFYGRSDERNFRCDPGSVYRPPPAAPAGTTWTYRCRSDTTVTASTVTLLAYEIATVGGTSVNAVHLRERGEPAGDTTGTMQREVWLSVSDGVLLREWVRMESHTSQGAIKASYREQYELRLRSLEPSR